MKKNSLRNQIVIVITTLLIAIFNTVLIKPEDAGSWKNYVGYAFLIIASINIIILLRIIRKESTK